MKKTKRFFVLLIVFPIVVVGIHLTLHSALKATIYAGYSVNPRATNAFGHALIISYYIKKIHDFLFINYDSVIFKPFVRVEDYFFQKGQANIAPDNLGEEGVWWYLVNAERYGFSKQGREDLSVDRSTLTKEEAWALIDKLESYFLAITADGVKGVLFGKTVSDAVHGLFSHTYANTCELYPRKLNGVIVAECWDDNITFNKELIHYQQYKDFVRKDPFVDEYVWVEFHKVDTLNGLIGYVLLQSDDEKACGLLLDDYLELLVSDKLDHSQMPPVLVKVINRIFKNSYSLCPEKRSEISNASKIFQKKEQGK